MASRRTSHSIARQACDACRVRKRKCDSSTSTTVRSPDSYTQGSTPGPNDRSAQCRRCADLGLPCTFLLPVATRGPRKKDKLLREAVASTSSAATSPGRDSLLESHIMSSSDVASNPATSPQTRRSPSNRFLCHERTVAAPSPVNQAQSSPQSAFSTESFPASPDGLFPTASLCSRSLLCCILNDYLDNLYPLIPVVHIPTFRKDIEQDRDLRDNDFLSLIISLCAVLVGIMPRKFKSYRTSSTPLRFQTRTEMINHCFDMLLALRGPDYFDQINHSKWACSYLMQIAFFQIGQHNRHRMIEVEAMQLARLLDFHKIGSYAGLNCMETQLRKKAFWLMFYGYVHSQLQHLRKERLTYLDASILSTINLQELMPLEVDDEFIHDNYVLPQPESTLSLTTGFNISSRIFWAGLITLDLPENPGQAPKDAHCMCVRNQNPKLQLKHMKERLRDLKYILDGVHPQLCQWVSGYDEEDLEMPGRSAKKVLRGQMEAMRANIHVSHLWMQSIINDAIDALRPLEDVQKQDELELIPFGSKELWPGREDTARQLLQVLHGIPEIYLEPNGHHLTYKVRDVAVTLLTCPFDSSHEISRRAYAYVREFTDILSRLDGSETVNTLSLQSWVDTGRMCRASSADG